MGCWEEKSWAEHVQTKIQLSARGATERQLKWPDGGSGRILGLLGQIVSKMLCVLFHPLGP